LFYFLVGNRTAIAVSTNCRSSGSKGVALASSYV
jgi:hypothetical protein